jgi:teichuronic acid biosynthesis glycosyltransferase TuaC
VTDALWITPGYPWRDEPAVGVFYRTQAQAVARLGQSVTVCAPTPWAPWPLPLLRPRWRLHADAPVVAGDGDVTVLRPRYPNAPGEPSWALPDRLIARAAWRTRKSWSGARVIHGHFVTTGLAAWRLARRAKMPFILTFHGSDMNSWPDEHPERLADLRAAVSQASAVIAVSAALADRVRDVTGVTAIHLPLGSDHRALRAMALPRAEARQRLGLADDRVVVLFVGNLKRTKGIRELADAVLGLGDPFLGVFVGGGAEAGYGSRDPRAEGRLSYVGARPHEDVVRYLSAADVLVLPSYLEGLPTVIVEAGSLGVPVIASDVGGIPELLGHDRGTILPDVSAGSIATALTRFVADRDGAAAAAKRLGDLVVDAYDVDRNAARLVDYYRAAAQGAST